MIQPLQSSSHVSASGQIQTQIKAVMGARGRRRIYGSDDLEHSCTASLRKRDDNLK